MSPCRKGRIEDRARGKRVLTVFLIASNDEGAAGWSGAPEIAMGGIAQRAVCAGIGRFEPAFDDPVLFVGLEFGTPGNRNSGQPVCGTTAFCRNILNSWSSKWDEIALQGVVDAIPTVGETARGILGKVLGQFAPARESLLERMRLATFLSFAFRDQTHDAENVKSFGEREVSSPRSNETIVGMLTLASAACSRCVSFSALRRRIASSTSARQSIGAILPVFAGMLGSRFQSSDGQSHQAARRPAVSGDAAALSSRARADRARV